MISFLQAFDFANRFYNSHDFDSNHRLVIADICIPFTKFYSINPATEETLPVREKTRLHSHGMMIFY